MPDISVILSCYNTGRFLEQSILSVVGQQFTRWELIIVNDGSTDNSLEIAERYFSVDETAALAALPAAERSAAFLELWTAKEAVLKALGRGIAFGLNRLSIASAVDRLQLQRLEGDDVGAWQLQRLDIDSSLVATLAWRGGERRIRLGTLASGA